MELHRPHEHSPFRSWSAFFVEIATIVIGVLIALSFEGVREWQHNRSLAREARETIVRELTENSHELDGDIKNAPKRTAEVRLALQYVNDLLQTGKTSLRTIGLNVVHGDLRRSSWQTAVQTGALGHMAFGDVQKYAGVYDLQELYESQERRSLEHMSDALVLVAAGIDPETAKRPDLERFRDRVLVMSADLLIETQLAHQLHERYATVLAEQVQ
ncbi:MAG TPA: hypothetical protein VFA27_17660 [Vicinamibacterales bacterium]|nr:hypothetical protein [Vicinamibacterales bacterium]